VAWDVCDGPRRLASVPFIIRCPGKVPAGAVNNEIVHEVDLLPTFAMIAGGQVPTDRVIDGVDQTDFFLGKKQKSDRESIVVYVGSDIYGVKWRNWKMMLKEVKQGLGVLEENTGPLLSTCTPIPRKSIRWTDGKRTLGCAGPLRRFSWTTPRQ
jgi:hypothetical protein